ncbi:MAG TPA: MGMT family protein [Candidatus Dorea intestinavium]|nr:MGMT family protein [Candidatus Dorea intestinavium]
MNEFYQQVYDLVETIPSGKVMSYGQIAWKLGRLHGARMVGRAARIGPPNLPWHRVVMSDGTIAGGNHPDIRKKMLKKEGIKFLSDYRVDMNSCEWKG